jgi:threonine aldolase
MYTQKMLFKKSLNESIRVVSRRQLQLQKFSSKAVGRDSHSAEKAWSNAQEAMLLKALRENSANPGVNPELSSSSSSLLQPVGRIGEFRSDTFTKPTPSMYMAMMDAQCGDDVYGEDPTVNGLEKTAAGLLEKEAAVFVPTCTMANLIAVGSWCGRGDGAILGDQSHIFYYEQGGASALMSATLHTLPNNTDGTLPLTGRSSITEALEAKAAWETDVHFQKVALVCLENTHNRMGGKILPPAYMDDAGALCKEFGVALHVDGARLMNAAVGSGHSAARLMRSVDTVSICLSKGLGAPLGALVVGSKESMAKVRRLRKVAGGGMRQAGVIAAAGLVGLKENTSKLAGDHSRTKNLARGLASIKGVLASDLPQTNILYFDLDCAHLNVNNLDASEKASLQVGRFAAHKPGVQLTTAQAFASMIEQSHRCKIGSYGDSRLRVVLHHQVLDEDVERLIEGAAQAAKKLSKKQ